MQVRLAIVGTVFASALWSAPASSQLEKAAPSYAQYDGFITTADASCEEQRWPLRVVVSDGKILIGNGSGSIANDGTFDFKYPRGADEFRCYGMVKPNVVAGTFEPLPFANCMYEFEAKR